MKIETIYKFNREEIQRHLCYQLITESIGGTRWDTGTNKRKLHQEFTDEEIFDIQKIYKKCFKWYTHIGIPDEITLSIEMYNLWMKLKQYCIKNFTIYGK